jgi:hypothetical protein
MDLFVLVLVFELVLESLGLEAVLVVAPVVDDEGEEDELPPPLNTPVMVPIALSIDCPIEVWGSGSGEGHRFSSFPFTAFCPSSFIPKPDFKNLSPPKIPPSALLLLLLVFSEVPSKSGTDIWTSPKNHDAVFFDW